MLSCSLSGEVPNEPVVSKKSGYIFEKRLILKALAETPECPVTQQPLTPEDLVPLQTMSKHAQPRPPGVTSISQMLRLFQEEWDTLLLESYKLKKHVAQIRQELSHALYQHDAACRVIARVTQERDKARAELAETRRNMSAALAQTGARGAPMDVEPAGISQGLVDRIIEKAQELQRWRKSKPKRPEGLASKSTIGRFQEASTATLHSPSESGILSLAISKQNSNIVFTGGVDSNIICWNRETEKIETKLQAHKKRVLCLATHSDQHILLSGSADKTINIWNRKESGKWALGHQLNCHQAAVNAISIHPLGEYFVSASDDGSWAFNNLLRGSVVQKINVGPQKIGTVELHPDGRLLGTGDSMRKISIWEIHTQQSIVSLPEFRSAVTSLCFSQNGYHLAASSVDGTVRVFDLRKTQLLNEFASPGSTVHRVKYDYSGQYLASAGPDLRVYQSKSWEVLAALKSHSKDVMDIEWGTNAAYLASVSKDRCLKFFGT